MYIYPPGQNIAEQYFLYSNSEIIITIIARQHAMHAERDIVLAYKFCLSLRLSVQCRYCVKTNAHIIRPFDIPV